MSSIPSVPLGGTASSLSISRASVGLMGLTWVDKAAFTPDEQAFKVIKEYINSTENPLLNTGAFYGPQPEDPMANLKLLNRYFQKYPEDTQKCILCVKGGFPLDGEKGMGTVGMAAFQSPNVTIEALRHELQLVRKTLGSDDGGKEIDLWEPARLPSKYVPLEKLVQMYTQAREEGLFKHLSLSEVKGETLEKVIQLTNGGVASVEVEYSVFCREVEDMGVLDVCEKYKVPILAYSPVGKGIVTGQIRSRADLPEGDPRLHQDSFSEEALKHNVQLADHIKELAAKHDGGRGVTPTQFCLAWLLQRSSVIVPIPGTRKPAYAKENIEAAAIKLTKEEIDDIEKVLQGFERKGERYVSGARASGTLWA